MARVKIWLECTECGSRNYRSTKKSGAGVGKLRLKKFCRKCRKHTEHKERKGK